MSSDPGPHQPDLAFAPVVVIEPSRGWASLGLGDVWAYRELLVFMVWRDVKGRYRQMAFGPLWIIVAPLIQMVIFSVLLGRLAGLPSEGIPYPVFTYAALLPWQFFASAARNSVGSLLEQRHVIAKVYFPRLVIPLSKVLAAAVDFLASFLILVVLMIAYRIPLTWTLVTLPAFLLLAAMTALAVGLWLAGLAVKFHDVALSFAFVVDVWKYLTPVVYSATLIPEAWRWLYRLNPMATVVEGFRWALLGTSPDFGWSTWVSVGLVVALLVGGAYYFRRTERTIVDSI